MSDDTAHMIAPEADANPVAICDPSGAPVAVPGAGSITGLTLPEGTSLSLPVSRAMQHRPWARPGRSTARQAGNKTLYRFGDDEIYRIARPPRDQAPFPPFHAVRVRLKKGKEGSRESRC